MRFVPSDYQNTITEHLLENEIAFLMVGMGLGKTAATLNALDERLSDLESRGALVVAPLRVANIVWPLEVAKWDQFRWMRVANLRTEEGRAALKRGDAQIYVINYEMLPKFASYLRKARSVPFDTVIWDEISKAKSHNSKRINAVRGPLRKFCESHWGLTGTPTPNSHMDLFAQVRLLDGGERLGRSFHQFRDAYFRPVDFNKYKWEIKDGAKERIEGHLADIALSMKTSEYLDLPDMVVDDMEVARPKAMDKAYDEVEREFLTELDNGEEIMAANSAVLVGKLMQFTSGAIYTGDGGGYSIIHDAKVDAVVKRLATGGNTLVVYNYVHELERLKKALGDRAEVFKDAKTSEQQADICERWNNGRIKVLLVHPDSMSHGLNLQGGGSRVIWVSPTYSREKYDQLNARLHRRGQKDVIEVVRVLMKDTIDYAVAEVLRGKGDAQDAFMRALKALGKIL